MKEILAHIISEGEKLLDTKFSRQGRYNVAYFVDADFFNRWYEKVKSYLGKKNLQESIVQTGGYKTNYDITKIQVAKLKGILELKELESKSPEDNVKKNDTPERSINKVFIGHGHHLLWARVALHLLDKLDIQPVYYESECRVSKNVSNEIESFVDSNDINTAIIIMMKEDKLDDETFHPRLNTADEYARFATKLGKERVVIVKEKGAKIPSNLQGIEYIEFNDDYNSIFYQIEGYLKREQLILKK